MYFSLICKFQHADMFSQTGKESKQYGYISIWGRYKKKWFRYELTLSFQFHHTQMDGAHAGRFLYNLQQEIRSLK